MIKSIGELFKKQGLAKSDFYSDKVRISIGMGTCGLANGAGDVFEAISDEVQKQGLDFVVRQVGCVGICQLEPIVDVLVPGLPRVFYHRMSAEKGRQLVSGISEGNFCTKWALARLGRDQLLVELDRPLDGRLNGLADVQDFEQLPFYKDQLKIALRNCGFVDPHNIEEYLAAGGYSALSKVLMEMGPEQIIDTIEKAGLRGRGGGGFVTGRKWRVCHQAPGHPKYIICNGDEGDPGAFMDRSVMESNPYVILEGMTIGAYAVGAEHGYIYVRLEYPLAVENLRGAIKQAREYGLLGENILGTGFGFDVQVSRGAGAFVCGEETALIASLMGLAGEPRTRNVYPAEKGLFGRPTIINNVETWANVPVIINKGWNWFAEIGSDKSKGTKVFSVVGKVRNTGLVEVPMGITLRRIIYDICGGILNERNFKGVQTGGPSGGCLPESLLDLQVDFDQLSEAGSMMGSGGMIVMDDHICVVEVARYFTEFLTRESCGKCTACREGLRRILEVLERITSGEGASGDIELLEELCSYIRNNSICGLGKTAPNPVLSTLRYFRDEYIAHIKQKKCPAGVCRKLTIFNVEPEKCKLCGKCIKVCPSGAVTGKKKQTPVIGQDKCIKCGLCREICPFEAVIVT
jgi:NADH:ubiquinone oxidoreductase subunit F (NADH-binding)/Pyruvate/2-oxoacid:ferredoxin oxidoreductase delta subunit/(2Fe-2S) ferredoxin